MTKKGAAPITNHGEREPLNTSLMQHAPAISRAQVQRFRMDSLEAPFIVPFDHRHIFAIAAGSKRQFASPLEGVPPAFRRSRVRALTSRGCWYLDDGISEWPTNGMLGPFAVGDILQVAPTRMLVEVVGIALRRLGDMGRTDAWVHGHETMAEVMADIGGNATTWVWVVSFARFERAQ